MHMYALFFGKKKASRVKRLTQKDITSQIEEITPGETASYRLNEVDGVNLATVEFNTAYPWSGRKYILSTRPVADTRRTGKREQVLATDEAREIADWLMKHKVKRRLYRRMVLPNKTRYKTSISA